MQRDNLVTEPLPATVGADNPGMPDTSRRTFLTRAGATSALLALAPEAHPWLSAAGGDITIAASARIPMLRVLGRTLSDNVLKLFSVLGDAVNNRIYVAGIMTRHIGVYDGTTHAVLGTVDTGIVGNSYKYMALDTTANRLYVHDGLNHILVAVNLSTGQVTGPVSVPPLTWGILADESRGLLYVLAPESPNFRILDGATLQTVATSTAMGTTVTSMLLDRASDSVWVMDQAPGTGRIFQYNLASRTVTSTISFALLGQQRATAMAGRTPSGAFWLHVPGRGILRVSSAGRIEQTLTLPALTFENMVYDPDADLLSVLFQEGVAEGEVAAVGARLWRYDGRTWAETSAFGAKPHLISLNRATGRIYAASGDESVVYHTTRESGVMTSFRVGDSVEHVQPTPGGPLYITSRLGGSYLTAYTPETGAAETFTAGFWPTALAFDPAGRYLIAVNAWDSTISIFEHPTHRLLQTTSLGIPRGTTDRLPDIAVDFTRGRAYAAYPEFGVVAVADWVANRPVTTLALSGFTAGDTGGGPHHIQVAVSESHARLFIYAPALRRLETYDISGSTPSRIGQATTSLETGDEGHAWKTLFVDAARDRVFVGPNVYDARTGRSVGIRASVGDRLFASDDARSVYWACSTESGVLSVHTLDRATLTAVDSQVLGSSNRVGVDVVMDLSRNLIYVTNLPAAEIEAFQIA